MKRMTYWNEERKRYEINDACNIHAGSITDRLAYYENIQEKCVELTGCGLEMLSMKYSEFLDDITELFNYRQAEEQGLLIKLPCKVGDTVYLILTRVDNGKNEILKSRCTRYSNNGECEVWSMWFDCKEIGHTLEYDRADFGKTVFLTRESAEEALKGGGVE